MAKQTDISIDKMALYLLPVQARMPLKFGKDYGKSVVTQAYNIRAKITAKGQNGKTAVGWGETSLSVGWSWPSPLPHAEREKVLLELTESIAAAWNSFNESGHPLEIGQSFIDAELRRIWQEANRDRAPEAAVPWLAALVCNSPFDQALHDAYGMLHKVPTYETYTAQYMNRDLSSYLEPAAGSGVSFAGKYPSDFLVKDPPKQLYAWHLVGGLDPVSEDELTGKEPDDEYPVLLTDWIRRDGLKCLKIKLRGDDAEWDYARVVKIGELAIAEKVLWLTADFNCTVEKPDYVNAILDRLRDEHPCIYGMLLYVEQPFPYEMEKYRIDVHSVAARKPLFMDESAHDWQHVKLGYSLGWNGVALKTCKTQTGALLSLCWAKAHGMGLMVQDLSNRMLAQIPHVLLAAYAGTIMGVESNGMQFYPDASKPEATVHPGLYTRHEGTLNWSSLGKVGFGYRADEVQRELENSRISL